MTTIKLTLPGGLNVPEFWSLPQTNWKNITMYDFRYLTLTQNMSKRDAHLAYSADIVKMKAVARRRTNTWQSLEACSTALEKAAKMQGNRLFWDRKAARVVEIASSKLVSEEEMRLVEQQTEIEIIKSFNKRKEKKRTSAGNVDKESIPPAKKQHREEAPGTTEQSSSGSTSTATLPHFGAIPPAAATSPFPNFGSMFKNKFESYKKKALDKANMKDGICLESNMFEFLALENVMLLKRNQYSDDFRGHFGDHLLEQLHASLVDTLNGAGTTFEKRTALAASNVAYTYKKCAKRIKDHKGSKVDCVRKLVAMTEGQTEAESAALLGIADMIKKLPLRTMLEGTTQGESELWNNTYDPILSNLFSDPESDVILRWPNVIPTEGSMSSVHHVRPDAIVCEIDQRSWGRSIGYGEVKMSEPTTNLSVLCQDMLRLAILSQKALSNSKIKTVVAFQVHGYRIQFYFLMAIPETDITAMIEVHSLKFPQSVEELDAFVTQDTLDTLAELHAVFWKNCPIEHVSESLASPGNFDISTVQHSHTIDRQDSCLYSPVLSRNSKMTSIFSVWFGSG